jgi:hypothetical protein
MRRVNILLSLSFFLASPIMISKDRTYSAENHPADPSTLSSSVSIDASIATPGSWRSTPGQILSRLLPRRGGASAQSVPNLTLLDAEQSDTQEECSSEEEEEAERPKKPEKTPLKADKRRGDSETHCGVGPHHPLWGRTPPFRAEGK